jgi:hypothetical protein
MLLHLPEIIERTPLRIVADAAANGIARVIERWTEPKPDPVTRFFTAASIALPSILQLLKPLQPVDVDGPRVRQVRRKLASEEARLVAEHAERRARLIADFGPRFNDAQAEDDEVALSDEL